MFLKMSHAVHLHTYTHFLKLFWFSLEFFCVLFSPVVIRLVEFFCVLFSPGVIRPVVRLHTVDKVCSQEVYPESHKSLSLTSPSGSTSLNSYHL